MNIKTIVAVSGIVIVLGVSQTFAGSGGFTLPINPNDPCAEGAVECRYAFTAKKGSNKQITMARTADLGPTLMVGSIMIWACIPKVRYKLAISTTLTKNSC